MFGDGGAGAEARRARQDEELRQQRISEGTNQIRQSFARAFNNRHYQGLMEDVKNAYQPEVDRQYKLAVDNLQAALMRSGLFESSIAATRGKDTEYAKGKADQEVVSRGIAAQNQRKQDVASAENSALQQLINTSDVGASMSSAANLIRTNTSPPVTPMLGQVFTDLSAGLATQADLERNNQNKYTLFGRIPGWSNANRNTRTIG